jgi:hypothetical protein
MALLLRAVTTHVIDKPKAFLYRKKCPSDHNQLGEEEGRRW